MQLTTNTVRETLLALEDKARGHMDRAWNLTSEYKLTDENLGMWLKAAKDAIEAAIEVHKEAVESEARTTAEQATTATPQQ